MTSKGPIRNIRSTTIATLVLAAVLWVVLLPSVGTAGLPSRSSAELGGVEAALDAGAFRILNGKIVNPVFDVVMPFVADSRVLRILAAALWLALMIRGGTRGRWAALLLIPLVAASDQLTSTVLKPLTGRLRPCEVLGNVHLWYQENRWVWTPCEVVGGFKTSFGFPSSHAANVTASALLLGLVYRKWVPYAGLSFAGLVSLSRVYTGVHWPSDVLAGIAIGAGLAWLAYLAFKRLATKRPSGKPPPGADRPDAA